MKFLPTENIIYKTRLKEEEIVSRLTAIVEPETKFGLRLFNSTCAKSYEGQIRGLVFDIKRIIRYRNSFLPRINGTIERDFDGMTIKVKMRMHTLIVVFLCLWCGVVSLICVVFLVPSFGNAEFGPAALIPFGMLLFVYALTMACFKFESNKSKKDLQALFEADIVEV